MSSPVGKNTENKLMCLPSKVEKSIFSTSSKFTKRIMDHNKFASEEGNQVFKIIYNGNVSIVELI